jgi:CRP-like cAMP-binding protein
MVGTTVETCIRTMSKFQKQGMVKSSGGRIMIKVAPFRKYFED